MKFYDFEKEMMGYPVFSSAELKTIFFKEKNILVQVGFWVKKGYLTKVRKGLYVLNKLKDGIDPMVLAHRIYEPSYLSLEFALNYHGLIPDIPGTYTSVCSRKTMNYRNEFGNYSYQKIAKNLFTGYSSFSKNGVSFNIATAEKALMDFFYLNKDRIKASKGYWQEMRIDEEFKFDMKKINFYKRLFNNKKVDFLIKDLFKFSQKCWINFS